MKYNSDQYTIYGKSTDSKPTGTFENINIEEGIAFYCIDTGACYIFDGENWVEQ